MARHLILAVMCTVIVASVGAQAQGLAVKRSQKQAEEFLMPEVEGASTACGTTITGGYDWSTFADEDHAGNYSISGYCADPLIALKQVCSDDLGKAAVAEQITRFTCLKGAQRKLELVDKDLRYTIEWEAANGFDFALDWLNGNL